MFAVYNQSINVHDFKLVNRICIYSTNLSSKNIIKFQNNRFNMATTFQPMFSFLDDYNQTVF